MAAELESSLELSFTGSGTVPGGGLPPARSRIFKIIVIGDSNVGKTCLTYRFCAGRFPQRTEATIGVDFRERAVTIDGERIKVAGSARRRAAAGRAAAGTSQARPSGSGALCRARSPAGRLRGSWAGGLRRRSAGGRAGGVSVGVPPARNDSAILRSARGVALTERYKNSRLCRLRFEPLVASERRALGCCQARRSEPSSLLLLLDGLFPGADARSCVVRGTGSSHGAVPSAGNCS